MKEEFVFDVIRKEVENPKKTAYGNMEKARIYKLVSNLSEKDFLELTGLVLEAHPHNTRPSIKLWSDVYKAHRQTLAPAVRAFGGECLKCKPPGFRMFWHKGKGVYDDKPYLAACRCDCAEGENKSTQLARPKDVERRGDFIGWDKDGVPAWNPPVKAVDPDKIPF